MRCEDFPCCGHDICPDFDENGRQLNMRCVCGAEVPLTSRSSICRACLTAGDEDFGGPDYPEDYDDGEDDYDGDYDDGPEDEWLDGSYEM